MYKRWIALLALMITALNCSAGDENGTSLDTPTLEHTNAVLTTSMGTIVIALNTIDAPATTDNFIRYANDGSYDGTIFHRVIPGFMIQGGGFDATMEKLKTAPSIENESKNALSNARGTIAMARTQDPHSATNQFFINLADNRFLDYGAQGTDSWGYAVFGHVITGMEVVDKIQHVDTTRVGPYSDVPKTPVVIESIRIEPPKE